MKYNLENGFYWVRINESLTWTVMEWDSNSNMWNVGGMPMFEPSQIKFVNTKRLTPPNEQPKTTLSYKPTFDNDAIDKWLESVEEKWICINCGNEQCNCK